MNTIRSITLALALAAAGTGCTGVGVDLNKGYADFVGQPNSAPIFLAEAPTNSPNGMVVSISISGASKVCLSTPVPAKSMLQQGEGLGARIVTGIERVAPFALLASGTFTPTPASTTVKGATTVNLPAAATTP